MTQVDESSIKNLMGQPLNNTFSGREADPSFVQKEDGQNNYDTKTVETQSKKFFTPKIPNLDSMPANELMKIKAMVARMSKDARKKSVAAIYKDPAISTLYSKALGGDANSEEVKIFQAALSMSPEAFVLNFIADILSEFDMFCKLKHIDT